MLVKQSQLKSLIAVITVALFVLLGATVFAIPQLLDRSLTIDSSIGGANTRHAFSFTLPAAENLGSIVLEYCTDPIDTVTCVNPAGSDVSGAVLENQSGEVGFSLVSAAPNQLILGRSAAMADTLPNSYSFTNIINPFDKGPFFVRITTYPSSDGTGVASTYGAVAGSINQSINIEAQVPDILNFCATVVIPNDCGDAAGDFIDFGTLTASDTHFATSQFMVGTNGVNGFSVVTDGPALSAGKHVIPAIGPPTVSQIGTSQFGINLRANLTPLIGADQAGGSGFAMPNYNIPNKYHYQDGEIIAQSNSRSVNGVFTVSYIVNINPDQPPGVYNTTITYVCTAGF